MLMDIPRLDKKYMDWTRDIIGGLIEAKINFQALSSIRIEDDISHPDSEIWVFPVKIRFLYNDFLPVPSQEQIDEWYEGNLHRATFEHDAHTLAEYMHNDFFRKFENKLKRFSTLKGVEVEHFILLTHDTVGEIRRAYPDYASFIGSDNCHFDTWAGDYVVRTNIDVTLNGNLVF